MEGRHAGERVPDGEGSGLRRWAAIAFALAAPRAFAVEIRTDVFIAESATLGPIGETYAGHPASPPGPDDHSRERCDKALLGDHAIHAGSKAVIALRRYFHEPSFLDADVFMKVSVEVPVLSFDAPIRLDAPGVRSLYTAGGEAWYSYCMGSRAMPVKGEMVLHREGETIRVILRIDSPVEDLRRRQHDGRHFHLEEGAPARTLRVEQLDAWQGGSAPSPRTP